MLEMHFSFEDPSFKDMYQDYEDAKNIDPDEAHVFTYRRWDRSAERDYNMNTLILVNTSMTFAGCCFVMLLFVGLQATMLIGPLLAFVMINVMYSSYLAHLILCILRWYLRVIGYSLK